MMSENSFLKIPSLRDQANLSVVPGSLLIFIFLAAPGCSTKELPAFEDEMVISPASIFESDLLTTVYEN
jgi:hypothetical protein